MAGSAGASTPAGFTLSAADVEGGKDGSFFFGTSGFQAAPWGNGTASCASFRRSSGTRGWRLSRLAEAS